MKVILLLNLLIAGSLSVPYSGIYDNYLTRDEQYEMNNLIDDSKPYNSLSYDSQPMKSLPLEVYEEIMHLKPSELLTLSGVLKAIIKPILKSAEFQIFTEFIDETMHALSSDPDVKSIVKQGVDYMQGMYEMADEQLIKQMLTMILSQYSDEKTARSLTSMVGDIMPTINHYILTPLKSFASPIISRISFEFENAVGEDMSRKPKSNRWSDIVDFGLSQLAKMTTDARVTLQETARFLQQQDGYMK